MGVKVVCTFCVTSREVIRIRHVISIMSICNLSYLFGISFVRISYILFGIETFPSKKNYSPIM